MSIMTNRSRVATAATLTLQRMREDTPSQTTETASRFIADSVHILGREDTTLGNQLKELDELRKSSFKGSPQERKGVSVAYLAALAALDPKTAAALTTHIP